MTRTRPTTVADQMRAQLRISHALQGRGWWTRPVVLTGFDATLYRVLVGMITINVLLQLLVWILP